MGTRLERVVIDLDDRFTGPAARIAASTDVMARRMDAADRNVKRFDRSNTDLGRSIDYMATRVSLLSHTATTFGTALVPAATGAAGAVVGLTNQLGFAAIAGGTAIVAFQGVGESLKAMGEYEAEPTAANFIKLREEMSKMGDSGQDFVRTLHELREPMAQLRTAAQDGLFPGLTESLDTIQSRFPDVERILGVVGEKMGELSVRGAEALAGPEWDQWFDMVATEARPALEDMGVALGNFTQGLAEMWMAFMPLSRDFGSGMADMSRRFNEWAQGLSGSSTFQDFLDYLSRTGPEVLSTLGSLTMALVDIGVAVAPIGDVALDALRGFAEALSAVASSDIGPPLFAGLAAMRAYSLAATIAARSSQGFATSQAGMVAGFTRQKTALGGLRSDWAAYTAAQRDGLSRAQTSATAMVAQRDAATRLGSTLRSTATTVGKTGAAVGGLALLTTGAADGMGLTNTASLALMGTMAGPWGSAIGAGAGLLLDLKAAGDRSAESVKAMDAALKSTDPQVLNAGLAKAKSELEGLEKAAADSARANAAWTGTPKISESDLAKISAAKERVEEFNTAISRPIEAGYARVASATALGFELTGDGARSAAEGLRSFTTQMAAANAAIARQAAGDSYVGALMEMERVLGEVGPGLNKFTAAGQANRAALQNLATQAFKTAEGMKGIGRENSLDRARDDFIASAKAAGATTAAAKRLADQFGLINRIDARPKVTEEGSKASQARVKQLQNEIRDTKSKMVNMDEKGAAAARARIALMRAEINSLRDRSITVRTNIVTAYSTIRSNGGAIAGMRAVADGGQVRAMHPGETRGARDDTIPAMLSHREYVQPVEAVDFYGEAFMSDIRARRFPKPEGYADGGLAGYGVQNFADGGSARKRKLTPGERANRQFDIGSLGLDRTRKELNAFEKAIDRSGGRVGKNFDGLSKRILRNAGEFQQLGRQVKATKEAQKSARDAARGAFDNDIFGGSSSDLRTQLAADRNDSRGVAAALAAARAKGLNGDLGGKLAGSGNLALAQEFAQMSRAEIASYQSLYAGRTSAQNSLANQTSALYAKELRESNRERAQIRRTLNNLERAVERGARAGTKGNARAKTTKSKAKGRKG